MSDAATTVSINAFRAHVVWLVGSLVAFCDRIDQVGPRCQQVQLSSAGVEGLCLGLLWVCSMVCAAVCCSSSVEPTVWLRRECKGLRFFKQAAWNFHRPSMNGVGCQPECVKAFVW